MAEKTAIYATVLKYLILSILELTVSEELRGDFEPLAVQRSAQLHQGAWSITSNQGLNWLYRG